ncbi:MAG: hypothetical protein ACK5IJ_10135 [Mangrovibacterium sp.]
MIGHLKITAVFLLCLSNANTLAQQKEEQIELLHLSVEEESFSLILDSIIMHEKACDYYDCELLFSVDIRTYEDKFLISIASQKDSNILLGLNPYGYFYYQNYLFIVDGEQCEYILSTYGTKKTFKYINYSHLDSQPKKGEKIMIYIYNDDSFSQWHYCYTNSKFILLMHQTCGNASTNIPK